MSAVGPAARDGTPAATATCLTCRHFARAVPEIEARLPGLAALGSGYGSVRSADGLCRWHDRYLAAASSCPSHAAVGGG